jgi:hypothetical protein
VACNGAIQTFHVYTFEQIAMGHCASLELLFKGRIPKDLCDDSPSKDSTLHWACSFDQFQVTELLLKCGVNVDITNSHGQTCLHVACKAGKNNFIDLFIGHGANLSLKDLNGKTARDLFPSNQPQNPLLTNSINSQETFQFSPPNSPLRNKTIENVSTSLSSPQGPSININPSVEDDIGSSDESDSVLDQGSKYIIPEKQAMKQLILWPPVQRQIQFTMNDETDDLRAPLFLSSHVPIIICATSDDIDIYPLLTWSGLVDTLNNLGLQSYVHRSTTTGQIRLAIDPILCPGRHRFEISISKIILCRDEWLTFGRFFRSKAPCL